METTRLEAFSDGVLAIIITIMVLELHAPTEEGFDSLRPLIPVFFSYVLSFGYIAIYWNNHHYLFRPVEHVDGLVLWCNLHLLFWLSLVPFATAWMGENDFARETAALYGSVLLMASIAYFLLARSLVRLEGAESTIARAMGHDTKGRISTILYLAALPLAFVSGWAAIAIYVVVAVMWVVPDRRIVRALSR